MPFENVPIIPRVELFGNPVKASPQISPDGKRLAWLAPDEGVLNVWVKTIGEDDEVVVTKDRNRGIRFFVWAFDGTHLLYIQDVGGDENWHIWSTNFQTKVIRDLTPFVGVQANIVGLDHDHPTEILAGLNLRDERVHDVHRINLATGATTLEVENPGDVVGWIADSNFVVRVAHAAVPTGGFNLRVRSGKDAPWRTLVTWSVDDEGNPYAFAPDNNSLYVGSSIGSDMVELREIDIETCTEKTLAKSDVVDLSDLIIHPTKRHIQAVGFNEDRLEWEVLDADLQADLDFLRQANSGELHIVSRDLADEKWIVLYMQDNAPAAYHTYARASKSLTFLFTTRPNLENYTLASMTPVHIPTRDGLTLHCYLTVPPGFQREKGVQGIPMVLNVHGGPWARDDWGYHPEAQWLANRGYACLQVNFRGSTGFGKKFLHAADREWGAKMHDDLIDAVNWAILEGFAEPSKVAIYGGSYGGYAALVGVTFTPEVFACAVDIVGPSNLTTLINSIPPYWEPVKQLFTLRIGNPETEPEFVDSCSPLFKVDQIQRPLLIAQGANDPRVKQAESEQIVAAMREHDKEVEYVLFEDEGHGFARPENKLNFYGITEKFLAKHLGGRAEDQA